MCIYIYIGVNVVGANMAFHDAICEWFEGAMLEPCLLKPCFHVAGCRCRDFRVSVTMTVTARVWF